MATVLKPRFKFVGGALPLRSATADDFKESEHPRAQNGQFTSGGGAGGKQVFGGVTAPKKGTSAHNIWSFAAKCEEQGLPVNTANVMNAAASAGVTLNKSNTQQTLPLFKKFQAGAKAAGAEPMKAEPAPAPKAPVKLKNDATTFGSVASLGGLSLEGNYSGITYYKNDAGTKASYDPSAGTWQLKQPDGTIKKGSDLNELAEAMKVDTANVANAAVQQAAKEAELKAKQAEAEAKAKADMHSTLNAALYAPTKAVTKKHNMSSKGAPTEEAFASGIQNSIKRYKGPHYKEINQAMRFDADYTNTGEQTMRDVLNLQRAFKLAPPTTKDNVVSRKIGIEGLKTMCKNAGINNLQDLQPGQVIRDEAVQSTSYSHNIWSGAVKFDITVPAGSKAIDISETINQGENELMLPPGGGYKITKVTQDATHHHGGYYSFIIECEHVT